MAIYLNASIIAERWKATCAKASVAESGRLKGTLAKTTVVREYTGYPKPSA